MGKIFGEYLKQLREDRKMTLRDVEEKAHISNAYLSQVERGERSTPTMKILIKLAEVYGVKVSVLNNKAEEELKSKIEELKNETERLKTKTEKLKSEIEMGAKKRADLPAPDTNFICRGYENLSEENKQTLKKFLQHLQSDQKEKK